MELTIARIKVGLSITDAAKAIGVARQTVANWERGRRIPSRKFLKAISEVYGIELSELIATYVEL